MELGLAIAFALAFTLTNGFHDASNAIATLVATRGARPAQAITLSAAFNLLGAVVFGTAVATTIAGIVTVADSEVVAVIGSGLLAATLWNLGTWWRGLPSSSGHALVGGLVGSALAEAGTGAVNWGGLDGWHPVGVLGVLIALAVSPVIGLAFGLGLSRGLRSVLGRVSRRAHEPIRGSEWVMSAALSFSHGANDAQKGMGAIAALLVATDHLDSFGVPLSVKVTCGAALTVGTALGAWRLVRRAPVGEGRVRRRGRGGPGARGMGPRAGRRAGHLPADADRRVREPDGLDRRDPRLVVPRRSRFDDAGGRIVGGGRGRRP